jgi:O-antigen/teichoic acid export membrane protein
MNPRPPKDGVVTRKNRFRTGQLWSDASVTGDGAVLFVGRLLAFVLVFLAPIILARVFSVEAFGLYRQVFLIYTSVTAILPLGLAAGLSYFVLRDPEHRSVYISQTVGLMSVIALIGGGVLALMAPLIANAMNSPDLVHVIPVLAILVALSMCPTILEGLMIASKTSRGAAATHLASEITRAGLFVGAALLTKSVTAVVVAAVLWAMARCIALFVYLRHLGVTLPRRPDGARLASQWRYAFPFGLAAILKTWADSLHFYLVAFLYSVQDFAAYSVGFMQIPLVDMAFTSLADVTLVRVTELKREERLSEARTVVASSTHKLSLVLFPMYAWLFVNAHEVIHIVYTDRFAHSAPILMVSLSTIPLSAIALDYVPRGFGDTPFVFRVNLVRLLLTGAFVLFLAHYLGPIGAASGTVLAVAVTKGLIIRHVSRLMGVSPGRMLPWGRLAGVAVAAAVAGIFAILVKDALPLSSVMSALVSAVPFSLAYAGLTWTCGILRRDEKASIRRAMLSIGKVIGQHA